MLVLLVLFSALRQTALLCQVGGWSWHSTSKTQPDVFNASFPVTDLHERFNAPAPQSPIDQTLRGELLRAALTCKPQSSHTSITRSGFPIPNGRSCWAPVNSATGAAEQLFLWGSHL